MSTEIQITCTGAAVLPLSQIEEFQGDLKTMTVDSYKELKKAIIQDGFSAPVFVWKNPEGKFKILDGHQRVRTVTQMLTEGYTVDKLPVDYIEAVDEQHAMRKLTRFIAQFGRVRDESLAEWLHRANMELDDIVALPIPNLDMPAFVESYYGDQIDSGEPVEDPYTKKIEAPIYEIKGDNPPVADLLDGSKAVSLLKEIESLEMPSDVRSFLVAAAYRHNVFNYEKIAEFYAHASQEIKNLMEQSALVIIDFDKAIENGFVNMSTVISEMFDLDQAVKEDIDD